MIFYLISNTVTKIGVSSEYLLGKSRELEHIKCLVEAVGALIDVDNHADPSRTAEEDLEKVG